MLGNLQTTLGMNYSIFTYIKLWAGHKRFKNEKYIPFVINILIRKQVHHFVAMLAQLLAQLPTHSFGVHRISLSVDPCITM